MSDGIRFEPAYVLMFPEVGIQDLDCPISMDENTSSRGMVLILNIYVAYYY